MDRIEFDGKNLYLLSTNVCENLKEGPRINGDLIKAQKDVNLLRVALSDKPIYYVSTHRAESFSNYHYCIYSKEKIDELLRNEIDRMSIDIELYGDKLSKAEMRIEFLEDNIDRHNEGGWIERLFNKIHKE